MVALPGNAYDFKVIITLTLALLPDHHSLSFCQWGKLQCWTTTCRGKYMTPPAPIIEYTLIPIDTSNCQRPTLSKWCHLQPCDLQIKALIKKREPMGDVPSLHIYQRKVVDNLFKKAAHRGSCNNCFLLVTTKEDGCTSWECLWL